jgi:hypothetical protein
MVYDTGLKILPDIIDEIAAGLIATGLWWNADTTWNTSVKTGDSARRALAYGIAGGSGFGDTALSEDAAIGATSLNVNDSTNFNAGDLIVIGSGATAEVRTVQSVSTGVVVITVGINTGHLTGEQVKELSLEMFVCLECLNTTNGYTVWPAYNAKGLRVTFASAFNSAAHSWSGTNYTSFIQFELHNGNVTADMAVLKINYALWYEAAGFVLMGTPEAHADNSQQTFFCCVERNTNKEYADGYTNWFCYNATNIYNFHSTGYNDNLAIHNVMRPWVFKTPEETWNSYNYNSTVLSGINAGIDFPTVGSIYAFRSVANSKVYFFKPVYQNARSASVPIAESELFFAWTEALGIGDGDIISVGTGTKQYIAKVMTGPDGSLRLVFAIKYQD